MHWQFGEIEFGEMKRNTSNWSNFCMLLRRAGLTASAGLSCLFFMLIQCTISRNVRASLFTWYGIQYGLEICYVWNNHHSLENLIIKHQKFQTASCSRSFLGKPQFFHFVKNDRPTSVLCSFGSAVLVEVEIERNEELAVNLSIVRHCVS